MLQKTKAVLSCTLVLAIVFALSVPVFALDFSDVTNAIGTDYKDAINYVSDNDIMSGTSENVFSPDRAVTRAAAVTVLYRMSGDTGTYTCNFTDVSSTAYYYNAVGWATQNGITNGITTTEFGPRHDTTREQVVTMFYRFAAYMGHSQTIDESITSASDYARVSKFSKSAVAWAYSFGLLQRYAITDAIGPKEPVPRKDLALLVSRYRTNVEGINFSRDSFSFDNNSGVF